jgi:hypothetical protein
MLTGEVALLVLDCSQNNEMVARAGSTDDSLRFNGNICSNGGSQVNVYFRASGLLLLPFAIVTTTVLSGVSSSAGFQLPRSVVDNGSALSSSASFVLHGTAGQGSPVAPSGSASYVLYSGYDSIPDSDGDGISDDVDNCPGLANPDQLDTDLDGSGNACDPDDDNDGLDDTLEITLGTDPLLPDTDGDGLSDYLEVNVDGDPSSYQAGVDSDPLDPDTDADGLPDGVDPDPLVFYFGDGDLAPYGAPDGHLNAADVLIAQKIVLGLVAPTALDRSHGDVYPPGAPDGVIDMSDLVLITRMMLTQP